MRVKIFLRATCICFAVSIFFYPVKQISHASSPAENNGEERVEAGSAEMIDDQQEAADEVISEQEEELQNEAEEPQEAYKESASESGYYDEKQSQEEPSEEYVPEPDHDERVAGESSEEYAPEPDSNEENQPVQIEEEQQPEAGGWSN